MEDRLHHRAGRDPGAPRPNLTELAPSLTAQPTRGRHRRARRARKTAATRSRRQLDTLKASQQAVHNHQHPHTSIQNDTRALTYRQSASEATRIGGFRLSQNASIGMYSTGHGSVAFSPDGTEAYYVHHGRPTPTEPQRRLYTDRMYFGRAGLDSFGYPILSIDAATSDRPIPAGVAPYSIRASSRRLRVRSGAATTVSWQVHSAAGAALALSNPLNAVRVSSADPGVATVSATAAGATVFGERRGRTTITVTYQRELSAGGYLDVFNLVGHHRQLVSVTIPVKVEGGRR